MRFPVPRLLVTLLLFWAVVPAVASADYDAEVLADQPTGYWRLDDTSGTVARNDIPGGTDGAYFGGPRLQSDGALLGSAAMMGGISSGLDLGPIPDGSRDFTVEAWSRQAGGGYYDMIFSRPGLWGVYSVDPGTSVICWGGRWPQGPSIHDDRWHLVTVRAKDGVLSLWIDGSLRTADTCPSLQGDAHLVAGIEGAGSGSPWLPAAATRGIDDVSVYDHALPDARIAAHAGARTAADDGARTPQPPLIQGPYSHAVLADHPWGYWRLEDDPLRTGTLIADAGGAGHDATIVGSRGWTGEPAGPVTTEPDRALWMNGSAISLPPMPAGTPGQTLETWAKFPISPGLYSTGLFRNSVLRGSLDGAAFGLDAYNPTIPGTAGLLDRAWHHLVFTFDAAAHEEVTYVDGTSVETLHGIATAEWFSAGPTQIGDVGTVSGMCLDEIALYDHVLSAGDVARHHQHSGFRKSDGRCAGTDDVPVGLQLPPPLNTGAPTVTGDARNGGRLTCDAGAWDGADTLAYSWERDGVAVAAGAAYTLSAADADTSLRCVVVATNDAGPSDPAASNATVWLRRPAAPTGVRLVNAGDPDPDGALAVTWDAVAGADAYVVEASRDGSAWAEVARGTATRLDLTGEADGTWTYRVRAVAAGVDGPTAAAPAVLVDTTSPALTLDCPSRILHVREAVTAAVDASDAGSGLTAVPPATLAFDTTSPGNRTLSLTVTDRAGHGTSASCAYSVRYNVPTAPRQTSGANPSTSGTIAMSWSPQGTDPNPATYTLQMRDVDATTWTTATTTASRTWNAPFGGLAEGTWSFRVRANDPAFDSDWSALSDPIVVDRSAPRAPRLVPDRAPEYTSGGNDWWADAVTVTFESAGDPDLADGSQGSGVNPASLPAARRLSTQGFNFASARATDFAGNVSSLAMGVYNIDATAPTQSASCPSQTIEVGDSVTGTWSASDSGSGLAGPSSGSFALDTSTAGHHTATAPTVRDRVGHAAPAATCSYDVYYDWNGFLAPLANEPMANTVTAGDAVPVRFSLDGNHGLGVISGTPSTVMMGGFSCFFRTGRVTETVPAGAPDLAYDSGTDRYTWALRSDPAWQGDCRELRITLDDGTQHRVLFRFV